MAARLEATGTFVFAADDLLSAIDFVTVDTGDLLVNITALGSEYCLAIEMLGQSNPVLVHNGDYKTLPRNPLTFGRDELVILMQVDGRRTVAEIDDASGLEKITAISILGKLVEVGVLLVKAERQSHAGESAADERSARTEPTARDGGAIDQAEMRSRIEETCARLKAKAFDAMIGGEAALLSRDSGVRPVPTVDGFTLDGDLKSIIDEALSEEEY